jgi:hypothetical protein
MLPSVALAFKLIQFNILTTLDPNGIQLKSVCDQNATFPMAFIISLKSGSDLHDCFFI